MKLQDFHKYDDIIHLPRHTSAKRAPMSNYDRAAQFSPFAALTGYEAVIEETGRLTDRVIELDEGGEALLDQKFRQLLQQIGRQPRVILTCFEPDSRKSGGAYIRISGNIKKIDAYEKALVLTDGTAISLSRIYDIEISE